MQPYLWTEELQPLCLHNLLERAVSYYYSEEWPRGSLLLLLDVHHSTEHE